VSYLNSSHRTNNLNLPNEPKTGQTVEILRYGQYGTIYVRSTHQTTVSGASNKIRSLNGFRTFIEVAGSGAAKFIFQGDYWLFANFNS
jgi:hypothetical protein